MVEFWGGGGDERKKRVVCFSKKLSLCGTVVRCMNLASLSASQFSDSEVLLTNFIQTVN